MDSEKALIEQQLDSQDGRSRSSYESEIAFYMSVQAGDIKAVERRLNETDHAMFRQGQGIGHLSNDPVRDIAYHMVITIALVSRFCIEGGMNHDSAYTLSDLYIQQLDRAHTVDDLLLIRHHACLDYTRRMNRQAKERLMSKPVVRAVDYIYANLQNKLTVQQIASYVGLHPTYLSAVFPKETGETLSAYIRSRKIALAKNMLSYSAYTSLSIANYLSFSSQSHFIMVFKKATSLTPEQYRRQYFRRSWMHRPPGNQ